jgi:hypothetical protein
MSTTPTWARECGGASPQMEAKSETTWGKEGAWNSFTF